MQVNYYYYLIRLQLINLLWNNNNDNDTNDHGLTTVVTEAEEVVGELEDVDGTAVVVVVVEVGELLLLPAAVGITVGEVNTSPEPLSRLLFKIMRRSSVCSCGTSIAGLGLMGNWIGLPATIWVAMGVSNDFLLSTGGFTTTIGVHEVEPIEDAIVIELEALTSIMSCCWLGLIDRTEDESSVLVSDFLMIVS